MCDIHAKMSDTEPNCCICLEALDINLNLILLPCNEKHIFHELCIKPWLLKHRDCPLCKKSIISMLKGNTN